METKILTETSSNGTLASLGHSLVGVGTATKAFVVLHPISMATAGGALLGIITYRSFINKRSAKKKALTAQKTAATVA